MEHFERWASFLGGSGDSKDESKHTPYYLKKGAKVSEKEAAALLAQPLRDFPFDIRYLTDRDIAGNRRKYDMILLKAKNRPESIAQEVLDAGWTDARANAARGRDGAVARRAAQNDILWLFYKEMTDLHGVEVSMAMLKERVDLDVLRSALYPRPDYEAKKNRDIMARFTTGKVDPKTGKPSQTARILLNSKTSPYLKTDYTSPHPPAWYVEEIADSGAVHDVIKRLDAFGKKED